MFLKEKLIKNFTNSKNTYEKNAVIQKKMQEVLLEILQKQINSEFKNILELGCGNGSFAKKIAQNITFEKYFALDIVDFSKDFLDSKIEFYKQDIEDFVSLEMLFKNTKFDLILSNAVLQWTNQEKVLNFLTKITKKDSYLMFSVFGEENLREIREVFGVSLKYFSKDYYKNILRNDWKIITLFDKNEKLEFSQSLDIFRHLKESGVNSLKSQNRITKASLTLFKNQYNNTLTYNPLYIIAQKK